MSTDDKPFVRALLRGVVLTAGVAMLAGVSAAGVKMNAQQVVAQVAAFGVPKPAEEPVKVQLAQVAPAAQAAQAAQAAAGPPSTRALAAAERARRALEAERMQSEPSDGAKSPSAVVTNGALICYAGCYDRDTLR